MAIAANVTPEVSESFTVFSQMTSMDHEQVVFCHDRASGLKSIIAVHNTVLGPALGGTRFWNYSNERKQ